MQSLTLKYGKIVNMRILGKDRVGILFMSYEDLSYCPSYQIVTSDPEHMKCILATNVQNWEKGEFLSIPLGHA